MAAALATGVTRIRGHLDRPLHRATYHLLLNAMMSSSLGFIYWLVAARLFPTEMVGRAGALVSAMALFALIGQLNLSGALMRFLPVAADRRAQLVTRTYCVAIILSVSTACVTLIIVYLMDPSSSLHLPIMDSVIFCGGVILWVIFILEDNVLIGLRRTAWITPENTSFGLAKLLLLVVFAAHVNRSGVSLYVTSVLPLVTICPVINWLIFRRAIPAACSADPPNSTANFSNFRRFVIGDAAGGILFQGWTNILPIVVAVTLGGSANALFYVAFLISTTLDLLAATMTSALVVEASTNPDDTGMLVASTVRRLFSLLGITVFTGVIFAPELLHLYGGHYADATLLLRLLMLSCLPKAAISLFLGVCRIDGRTHLAPAAWGAVGVSVLALSLVLGSKHGITGVGMAVLISTSWVGVLCAIGIYRFTKARSIRQSA